MLRYSASTTVHPMISAAFFSYYGNATLSGISGHLLERLQSVMNSASSMIYSTSRFAAFFTDPASAALAESSSMN